MVRVSRKELLDFYEAPLPELQAASSFVRRSLNGARLWYNRNFHIEPSNICAHRCRFCSYRRDDASQIGAWSMELDEILPYCENKFAPGMTEIHIVGSVHPDRPFSYYRDIVSLVRRFADERQTSVRPITVKAYTAVEIDDMFRFNHLRADFGNQLRISALAEWRDCLVRTIEVNVQVLLAKLGAVILHPLSKVKIVIADHGDGRYFLIVCHNRKFFSCNRL